MRRVRWKRDDVNAIFNARLQNFERNVGHVIVEHEQHRSCGWDVRDEVVNPAIKCVYVDEGVVRDRPHTPFRSSLKQITREPTPLEDKEWWHNGSTGAHSQQH